MDHSTLPCSYAVGMAAEKARFVSRGVAGRIPGAWVLAADTVVVLGGRVMGKPRDRQDARRMLEQLQDRRHEVITGLCLLNLHLGICKVAMARTDVWMRRIGPGEIDAYLDTEEPFDKAGGYGIQGLGGRFVRRIQGSYTNVVGLPVERVQDLLKQCRIL